MRYLSLLKIDIKRFLADSFLSANRDNKWEYVENYSVWNREVKSHL
ncbi:hypothetical protein [Chondrinema litorale]|nr:hypothetical protein [Chondrinema litorale]UZR99521.1 hypothetical protein OQ292_36630 [Chondrinema litorale]